MIKFVIFDFDGVFTDGKFYFNETGITSKCYNAKDALSLKILKENNILTGIITNDKIVSIEHAKHIFNRLDKCSLGDDRPKLEILDSWLSELNLTYQDVAYIGDDLADIPILQQVEMPGCPNDALESVKTTCKQNNGYICNKNAGEGAVREFVDLIVNYNEKKKICFCVPARYNSSRLDKKLLLPFRQETCIQKTVSQLYSSKYFNDNIFVFTDSVDIQLNLKEYNCTVILTDGNYKNGTERIAKNLNKIDDNYNIIVNVQGDEPFISHTNVDYSIDKHISNNDLGVFYTTLHETNNTIKYLDSTASLKVIVDNDDNVIYYSRNIIPFNKKNKLNPDIKYNTFTGIYVYDKTKILEYDKLNDTFLQNEEDCEQLKLIENGYKIKSYKTIEYNEISLNTQDDYNYLSHKYCSDKNSLILDCTLRDGGYINNWRFSENFILEYIDLMNKSDIDFVEIGFINKTKSYKGIPVGKCRNIDEDYLKLYSKRNFKVSVLTDYQDVNIDLLKNTNNLKYIDLVRVAFHKKDMNNAINTCILIQELGYNVSVNAMAITNYNKKELNNLFTLVNENHFNILYIADSYGSLTNTEIKNYIQTFDNKLENTSVGIHLHNNMNNAFNNYISSQDVLTKKDLYVDCTLFGMGRGAGNLQTELVLNHRKLDQKILIDILIFIDKYLLKLYNNNVHVNWGYELDYFLSGLLKMHPNYINKFREIDLSFNQKLIIIEEIVKNNKQSSFSLEYINNIINNFNKKLT